MTQQPTSSAPHTASAPARVLIADDDPVMGGLCARALAAANLVSVITSEADAAIAALNSQGPFDLLLADVHMPGRSGLELAQLARDIDPAIAVVIMTGHTSLETLHGAARRGVADYLSKPFEIEELQVVVEQALHKRRLLQESLRGRALEQLMRSSEAINAILDREQLTREIVRHALEHQPCKAGFLLVAGTGAVRTEQVAEPEGAVLLPGGYDAVAQALRVGRPLVLGGHTEASDDQSGVFARVGTSELRFGLAVPLRAQAETIGALLLCDDQAEWSSPGAQEIIGLLANQAGNALRNAHLYGELESAYKSLREFDRMKSEFIAIASHELRSPLSIVMGYAKMVRDRSEGEQRDYSQRVLDGAERIKTIVDDMMRLRDYDRRQTQLALEEVDLGQLVQQQFEQVASTAQQKQLQVELHLPEKTIITTLDPEKTLLVINNLVGNALKFTAGGGRVTVRLEEWSYAAISEAVSQAAPNSSLRRLSSRLSPHWAVVRVSDTGIGVARDQQAKIFERFYQVANSLTREQGGVGLGLAIACELSTLQDGVVWVESEEGQGSVFSFALPIVKGLQS